MECISFSRSGVLLEPQSSQLAQLFLFYRILGHFGQFIQQAGIYRTTHVTESSERISQSDSSLEGKLEPLWKRGALHLEENLGVK